MLNNVCNALKLQKYPDGLTAIDAREKCGTAGLENDPLVLSKISELEGKEFWIGFGIYTPLTPWIETMGCFLLSMNPSTVIIVPSVGLCQHECSTAYFSFNKADNTCNCLNITEIQLNNGANLSSCLKPSAETVLIYKIYTLAVITPLGATNGLCTTLTCTPPHDVYLRAAPCKGVSTIKGLCEDGMPSTSQLWSLSHNQVRAHCWNKDELLLHSNACQIFALNLTAPAWTNIFREEIEVEQSLGDRTALPKFCLSANILDKKKQILNKHRRNCSTKKLEWFVCKNDSTTDDNTYHTHVATNPNYGAIVGGSVGVVIVLLIGVTVTLCKLRRVGIFKNNNPMKSTNVSFTKSLRGEATSQQHVNLCYGLVYQGKEINIKTNNAYAQVQKVKRVEDTYIESSNGEYDHLHKISRRIPTAGEHTYDSNAGVRNRNDPTYDTATVSTEEDMDNTYDHSFSNMKTYSEYDVSDPSMQIDRKNYDAYDQTF
ncbi:unnamed protein product [Mytilus edulis]|uniref:Uncharacterized protein n=1 Tax=Mytilus edulis TaxID=6550 RepID=A0A8S3U5V4_MYTED|nr:unnamed protein product [Mytilus edulis]